MAKYNVKCSVVIIVLVLMVLLPIHSNAKIKVYDEWVNNVRCTYTQYKKFKASIYTPEISFRINEVPDAKVKDIAYIITFREFIRKSTDPSFLKGHKMLVKLTNGEIMNFELIWEGKPKITFSSDVSHTYTTLDNYVYPGYLASAGDIEKMIEVGVEKIRLEHSQGYIDFLFYYDGKINKCNHIERNKKQMLEMWNAVNEKHESPAPEKPWVMDDTF